MVKLFLEAIENLDLNGCQLLMMVINGVQNIEEKKNIIDIKVTNQRQGQASDPFYVKSRNAIMIVGVFRGKVIGDTTFPTKCTFPEIHDPP